MGFNHLLVARIDSITNLTLQAVHQWHHEFSLWALQRVERLQMDKLERDHERVLVEANAATGDREDQVKGMQQLLIDACDNRRLTRQSLVLTLLMSGRLWRRRHRFRIVIDNWRLRMELHVMCILMIF